MSELRTLLIGYKVTDLNNHMLEGDTTVHTLDIYHCHSIHKVFKRDRVVCTPHLPEGPWDLIKFKTGPKLMSGELTLDLFQEIVKTGAKWELEYVGKERDKNELIDKVTKNFRERSFKATWQASVPGGKPLTFVSYPGCFCHRRQDEGGLALAEVVSRELNDGHVEVERGRKVLDMGCGCGLVGLLINSVCPIDLTCVDSHTRAIEACEENIRAQGANARAILSDNGIDELGAYDIFVGNPPYYSDYRIAEVFLETAKKCLKPGGVCYQVVKNADGLKPVQEKYFPQVEVIKRRGYAVLKSIQNN